MRFLFGASTENLYQNIYKLEFLWKILLRPLTEVMKFNFLFDWGLIVVLLGVFSTFS